MLAIAETQGILWIMPKPIAILVILLCSVIPLLAASEETPADEKSVLLDSIIAVQSKLHNANGKINYKISYPKEKERSPEVYQAKLSVEVPNKYKFVLKKDDQIEKFISDGKVEWHVEDIDGFVVDSKKELKKGKGKFAGVTDYIPLQRKQLEKKFKMEASLVDKDCKIKKAHCQIMLKPISADQKDHIKWTKIYFDKKYNSCCIQILDADGNLYDVDILEMKYNTKIPKETFIYKKEE